MHGIHCAVRLRDASDPQGSTGTNLRKGCDHLGVVDERARDIVKDMLSRLERLETKVFPSDPFDA